MDSELARKRPATIMSGAPIQRVPDVPRLPRTEVLPEVPLHQKQILMAQVRKMARRGEIGPTYRIQHTERGWAVQVVRLREPSRRPAWVKPVGIVLGALAVGAGVLWLVALAVQALAAALAAALPVLLGVLGVLALGVLVAAIAGSGSGGGPVQNNYFR
jgi:hypothetical protein